MIQVAVTHTREHTAYMAKVVTEYALTAHEQEVMDLAKHIATDKTVRFPALHALSVLPNPDPLFVRLVSNDVFDLVEGRLAGTLPIYQAVLDTLDGWWKT